MAFDSVLNVSLKKPTFAITVNDWNLDRSLALPVIVATLNSYNVNASIVKPTLDFSVNIAISFSLDTVIGKPALDARFESSCEFSLTRALKKPSLDFRVDIPLIYSLNQSLPSPVLSFSSAQDMAGVLTKRLLVPVLSFTSVFTSTGQKQTWVFNTITGAHSRYTNFDFDSYFKLGSKYYGILNGDIYEFTGDLDGSTEIDAEITLPISAFNEQSMKACSDAFLYGRGNGNLEIDVITDEQKTSTGYLLHHDLRTGMHRIRAKIPKGLMGNTWQFKLRNVNGSYFDVNGFEVFLRTLQRVKW